MEKNLAGEMGKIRISAVKYANTFPFIWGLRESGFEKKVILETDHPSGCAAKLKTGMAEIGLVPVAAIPDIPSGRIISNYCIGASGKVRTVMLLSNCPFEQLDTIYLDYRSRTSVTLVKVLAANLWKKNFRWIETDENTDFFDIPCNEAVVLIGDQCFESESKFSYRIDLSEEWNRLTALPFVFACWISTIDLPEEFISEFNSALRLGIDNLHEVAADRSLQSVISGKELEDYLRFNIDFNLDERKRKAMDLFHAYMKELH